MSHARTGSLPDYLQENYRSAEQMKVWWEKRAQQAREEERARKDAGPDGETKA